MSIVAALILGVIEGVTEFLPVSSTGHLILASSLLGVPSSEFAKTFEILIQLGAILAVVCLYWRKLLIDREMFKRVAVAFIPTAVIGLAVHGLAKKYLLGNSYVVVVALMVGGMALIIFEWWQSKRMDEVKVVGTQIPYKTAAYIGIFQALAIIPGVSRSAATIVGGMLFGMSRSAIVEFSFLLAVPTMVAASGLDLLKTNLAFTGQEWAALVVGFVTAFVVAFVVVKVFVRFIQTHTFTGFGLYRIALAVIFLFILL